MKLTKSHIKQLIKEELTLLNEGPLDTAACNATIKDIRGATKCILSIIRSFPGIQQFEQAGKLKIDTGTSKNFPGGIYLTFLGTEDLKKTGGGLQKVWDAQNWLARNAYELVDDKTGFAWRVGYTYNGWQKPPSDWGIDPQWYVQWNGYIKPVATKKG